MAKSCIPVSAAFLAALSSAAFAQSAAPAAGEPSFLSGGLKLTVASIAVAKARDRLSVALVIENQRDEGVLVAMLGHALAVDNRGNTFATREVGAVAGIAGCGTNMGAGVAPYVLAAAFVARAPQA
jgi:hypothetical protein